MAVIDADAHVQESVVTFADPYWDAALADRRPQVVRAQDFPYWLIDGRVFPRRVGKGAHHFSTPMGGSTKEDWYSRTPDPLDSVSLTDLDARVRYNQSEGIDLQVIFPTLFLAYPLSEDPTVQNALCRSYNSWMADLCRKRPQQLKWVAVINLDDVQGAVEETRRAHQDLGAVGIVILGTVGDDKIDRSRFDPFYAELCKLDLPLAVHVGWPSPSLAHIYDTVWDSLVLPFAFSMFTGFVDIVAGGVLDRHPDLRVGFFEAGCQWIPYLVERMDHYYEMAMERARWPYHAKQRPSQYLRSGNVYFGFEVEDELLPYVLKQVGASQFLYASDIPHGDRMFGSVDYLGKREDISDADKELLLYENAARFFRLQ